MKEPFVLYKRCEKDGRASRCETHPACDCDWYDRPSLPDGRRPWVRLPHTAASKALAYKLAQKKRQDEALIAEGLKKRPKPPAPLLSAYITTYQQSPDAVAQKTKKKRDKNLADFLAHVKDRPIDQVIDVMIDDWRTALLARHSKKTGGTWSRNTAQRVYNSVKGLFTYAAEHLEEFDSPCDALKDWSEDPAERVLWQPDQLWLIDELPDLFRLPLKIGMLCGCRRAEALQLTKHDLSPKGFTFPSSKPALGWIALQRKKKRVGLVKARIPIALSLVRELHKQLKSPFQLCVFGDPPPDADGWSSQLTRQVRALGDEYGIDTTGLCMHGTRHTATTTMQDAPGVSTGTAKNMGGWTTTRMVETYSSPAEASMQLAAAALANHWKPVRPKGLKRKSGGTARGTAHRPGGPRSTTRRCVGLRQSDDSK